MIKFHAFGEQESYSEDSDGSSIQISREAQEELLNKLYYDALQAASKGDKDGAIELLRELQDKLESGNCIVHDTVHLGRLKYLTYKNIGLFSNDFKSILQALEIDSSDFNLWISAGRKSKEEGQYFISKYCFERAFHQNQQNVIVIDNLIDIYFIINEFYNCSNMCLFALKIDSEYPKALILLNECVQFDKILLKDLDPECLQFVSTKVNGKLDFESLLENEEFEIYKSNLMKSLNKSKTLMFKPTSSNEDEVDEKDEVHKSISNKKKQFIWQSTRCVNLKEISKTILNFYEQIQQDGLNICSKIVFEDDQQVVVDSCENIDDERSTEHNQESNGKPTQEPMDHDQASSEHKGESSDFNISDFVDKRRSTRNKKVKKDNANNESEKSQFELLLELFPGPLKNSSLRKENSHLSNLSSNDHKDENSLLTKQFVDALRKEFKRRNNTMNIYQLIRFYLIQVSSFKNFIIPDEFIKLYKVYREFQPLPGSYEIKIPEEITLEMIQVCLTANELSYDQIEATFLQEMMGRLSELMEPSAYREYLVRLQVLLGNAKWDSDNILYARDLCSSKPEYAFVFGLDLAEDMDEPFQAIASNQLIINTNYLDNALEMLSFTSNDEQFTHYKEIIRSYFTKLEMNLTDDNKNDICDAVIALKIWEKGLNLIDSWVELTEKCFNVVYCCVVENDIKITPNLLTKVAKKAIDGKNFDYWKILLTVLEKEYCDVQTMANFYMIAHTALGRNGLCTSDNGKFLLQACEVFQKADFDEEVEFAYGCLFKHNPRKIDGHLVHSSPEVPLEWKHCKDIFNFIFYEGLPEYDSINTAISAEEKDLLIRMLRLIPAELTPLKGSEFIRDYIENGIELDDTFPEHAPPQNDVTSYIYYYLADYFFKSKKDFTNAKMYYIFDLTLNPTRFDSWAALALSINYEIDEMLVNAVPNFDDYLKKAFQVSQCYEQALNSKDCNKLRMEYGLLMYTFANFLSRNKRLTTIFGKPIYPVPKLSNEKLEQMLDYQFVLGKAKRCFEMLNSSSELEEPWLVNYMLGKISEKNSNNIIKTLQYYEWSSLWLYLDGALYPKKIQYVNNRVPHLSVEALELYYRIHSSILKYLNRNSKFSARNLRKIKLLLIKTQKSPFITRKPYSEKKLKTVDDEFDAQVTECLTDLLDIVYEREKPFDVNSSRRELVEMCKVGIVKCLERYPFYYKPYYRYADELDPKTAIGLLIGNVQQNRHNPLLCFSNDGKKSGPSVIPGLFSIEKGLFINIWRLPGDEIERSGKFGAHMFRLINLLLEICDKNEDSKTLEQLFHFLRKSPELEKRYLNELERIALAEKAEQLFHNMLLKYVNKIQNQEMSNESIQKLYQQFQYMMNR